MNTRLLELIRNHALPQIITDDIKNSQFQNNQLKRKYSIDEDCSIYPTTSSLNTSQATSSTEASDVQVGSATSLSYRQGMEFVENFKKARMEKGLNKMDWVTCLAEDKKMQLFSCKNTSSLRNQYAKYLRNKSNESNESNESPILPPYFFFKINKSKILC
jgi:hypothetical protein